VQTWRNLDGTMSEPASSAVDRTRTQRFAFLRALYDAVDGDVSQAMLKRDIGSSIGFDDDLTDRIVIYLSEEQLINWVSQGFVSLSHEGLKEVESAIVEPSEPTEHFPPNVVVYASNVMAFGGSVTGSQIQQGTIGSTQSLALHDVESLRELVMAIEEVASTIDLSDEQAQELEADTASARAQLESPRPKPAILREALTSARAILEGAAGGGLVATAPDLIQKIDHALALLAL
jgi:hypothetical protein